MRSTTVICDKCGDIILSDASVITMTAMGSLRPMIEQVDLCESCSHEILNLLRSREREAALTTR